MRWARASSSTRPATSSPTIMSWTARTSSRDADDGSTLTAKVVGHDDQDRSGLLKIDAGTSACRMSRSAIATSAGRRLGHRGRQSLRPGRHGHRRHRVGAMAATSMRAPMTTSCRSTRRSIPAIRAGRCSTRRARWSASTPRSTRRLAAASASASPFPPTCAKNIVAQLREHGRLRAAAWAFRCRR